MKALVGAFNQEKALVGDFSVIVKSLESSFEALLDIVLVKLPGSGPGHDIYSEQGWSALWGH